ncbi:MAG: YolD-like family protein [Hungatella sp.]|nr:YolD-like family protein [Hungatella sp.]
MQEGENMYRDEQRSAGPGKYEDMLDLPHHVSSVHPQMALSDRAAQFAPFAALTGYGDAIRETARLTDDFVWLDEDNRGSLDGKLRVLQEHIKERPEVTVTFFRPDGRKTGGAYETVTGNLKKIDTFARKLVMADGTAVLMEYVIQMECGLFWEEE